MNPLTWSRCCRVDELYVVEGLLLAHQVLVAAGVVHLHRGQELGRHGWLLWPVSSLLGVRAATALAGVRDAGLCWPVPAPRPIWVWLHCLATPLCTPCLHSPTTRVQIIIIIQNKSGDGGVEKFAIKQFKHASARIVYIYTKIFFRQYFLSLPLSDCILKSAFMHFSCYKQVNIITIII